MYFCQCFHDVDVFKKFEYLKDLFENILTKH